MGIIESGEFTDTRDGQKYRTVKIGNQVWMAENLNFEIDGSWRYDSDEANAGKYGRLYTWDAAMAACPAGWHLATREEWETLLDYAGDLLDYGDDEVAGKKLKSKYGWDDNGNGTDEFGFSALPGGVHDYENGRFCCVGEIGSWWTATEYDAGLAAYIWDMNSYDDSACECRGIKAYGISVRCVRDGFAGKAVHEG